MYIIYMRVWMYIYTYIFMQPSITADTTSVSAAPPPTEAFVPCENYLKIKKRVRGHFLGYIQAHVQMATMRCVASLHVLRCNTACAALHHCIHHVASLHQAIAAATASLPAMAHPGQSLCALQHRIVILDQALHRWDHPALRRHQPGWQPSR